MIPHTHHSVVKVSPNGEFKADPSDLHTFSVCNPFHKSTALHCNCDVMFASLVLCLFFLINPYSSSESSLKPFFCLHLLPPRFDDFYFLPDPEEFIDSHFPDEEKWQLLETPIPLEEFERRVFKTSVFFNIGLRLIQPHHFHIITGRPVGSVADILIFLFSQFSVV